MSLIIAARFETFDQAKSAAAALMDVGVVSEDLHTFFVNPAGAHGRLPMGGDRIADPDSKGAPFGAVGGAAGLAVIGAVIGALIGFSLGHALFPVAIGAGLGAYIGSLMGGVSLLGRDKSSKNRATRREAEEYAGRPAGVLLAVHVQPAHQQDIAAVLRRHGGMEVERAQGRWENGQWQDFDPLEMPHVTDEAASPASTAPSVGP